MISGKRTEIIADQTDQGNEIQYVETEEHVQEQADGAYAHGESPELICSVSSGHKRTHLFSHAVISRPNAIV